MSETIGYPKEALQEMEELSCKYYADCFDLQEKLIVKSDTMREEAKKHAIYGIARRLRVLRECMQFFFEELPPTLDHEADGDLLARGNAMLHAYLINSAGIHDNIAWLIAYQAEVDKEHDLEKKRSQIGLFNKWFKQYLPTNLKTRAEDETFKEWFKHIINNRHPTAHRIPPYIIPYVMYDDGREIDFTPQYVHDFEAAPRVYLHAQCITDIGSVVLTVNALVDDLDEI